MEKGREGNCGSLELQKIDGERRTKYVLQRSGRLQNRGSQGSTSAEVAQVLRKKAEDTLVELGLADNCIALDARIFSLLKKVGVRIAPDDIYKQIEEELIEKVAKPLRISGAELDRILFQNYEKIANEI